jgi:hypothetical protein
LAVDVKIYFSTAPFHNFVQLTGLQFSRQSQFVSWATCEQSTDYQLDGQLYFLATPRSVLIIQDGVTRAGFWDGVSHGHINPTPSPSGVTQPGFDGTKIGLWMAWSNNRLWVSRGSQIFASDIGNPLKFTEAQYLNEARAFYLSGNCTGIIETPDKDGILCFTAEDGTLLLSSIQDRSKWTQTENFQKTILPSTGCVAPRSLVNQYGLTWWFSATGLQNLNSALNQNISSKISYQDAEMSMSKQNIGSEMSIICSWFYENYMVVSVPSGDPYNRHTWCLDQNPYDGSDNVWPSIWTGWRPVEWAGGMVGNRERVFFLSKDLDGAGRIWEAFLPERQDNGCAITCYLLTKQHTGSEAAPGEGLRRKRFRFGKAFLTDILGNVSLRWWATSPLGSPYTLGSKEIVATRGQVYSSQTYSEPGEGGHLFTANRRQGRIIYSEENMQNEEGCTSCGVQTENTDNAGYAFGLFLVWSGDMAVSAYQVFMSDDKEKDGGRCEESEIGPRSLNSFSCGDASLFPDGDPFGPAREATAHVCVAGSGSSSASSSGSDSSSSGDAVCSTQTRSSIISQEDATRKAECAALFDASFRAGIYI